MVSKVFIAVIVGVAVVVGLAYLLSNSGGPGQYDAFAKCLTSKDVKFYGTFWCPHCKNQKELFGSSIKYVNYIECSTPDGSAQLPVCNAAGIQGYPTWVFKDGTNRSGEVSLQELSDLSGCPLK